jgi:hypothetical protein
MLEWREITAFFQGLLDRLGWDRYGLASGERPIEQRYETSEGEVTGGTDAE